MILRADYHSHTTYSDGKGKMEDTILAAREKGLKTIGFSDHAWGHTFYGYKKKKLPLIREELEYLRKKYPDMKLIFSVEANILNPEGDMDLSKEDMALFDFVLAGYHFGSRMTSFSAFLLHAINIIHKWTGLLRKTAIKKNTLALTRAMKRYPFHVLTHPGDKGPIDTIAVAKIAYEEGILLEVNERHHHLTTEQLRLLKDTKNRFLLSSDAHLPEKIGEVQAAYDRLLESEIELSRVNNLKEDV